MREKILTIMEKNSRIDLEDLLYDGQEPAVSER